MMASPFAFAIGRSTPGQRKQPKHRTSRDGRRLFGIGAEPRGELKRYDAGEQELVPYLNRLEVRWVTFSPNGRWVALHARVPDSFLC
ncbi:MAG TPA: hypothetical protein VMX16_07615 [Terriglobia bacterium]|nr:hypothetical protein [Terriglobia bacterium]